MSLTRQERIIRTVDPTPGVSVSTLAYEYKQGVEVPRHAHGSDQLIYAIRGVMEVSSTQNVWLIPPQFALWMPARTFHKIHMPGPVSMRSLYFRPGLVPPTPTQCAVFHVTSLLRELILETVRIGRLRSRNREEGALRDLLISRLRIAPPVAASVALPRDPRALAVAHAVLADPAQSSTMTELCNRAGASVRTIERAFQSDVGTDFESWRRQVRLMKAMELLVSGRSVKEVAFAVGYRHPSAFVQAFPRTLGATPKAWTSALQNPRAEKPRPRVLNRPPSSP
jgi:AraC-like DNA-binding protein